MSATCAKEAKEEAKKRIGCKRRKEEARMKADDEAKKRLGCKQRRRRGGIPRTKLG